MSASSRQATIDSAERTPPRYISDGATHPWNDWRRSFSLVRHLTRRHLAARYRGSVLGFFWSLLNPVLMMVIYTVVFKYIFRLSAPGVPYPVFFLTGLLAWSFVQTATMNGATSILDNSVLIHQSYFPRIALPASAVLSNAFNYVVSVPILLLFCTLFGIVPGWTFFLLPVALLQLLAMAFGLALITACLTPFFRDLVQLLEVAFIGWFFATPVLYPASLPQTNLPVWVYRLYELNPMAGVISMVRVVFLQEEVPASTLIVSWVGTAIILGIGLTLFRRLEPRFSTVL